VIWKQDAYSRTALKLFFCQRVITGAIVWERMLGAVDDAGRGEYRHTSGGFPLAQACLFGGTVGKDRAVTCITCKGLYIALLLILLTLIA